MYWRIFPVILLTTVSGMVASVLQDAPQEVLSNQAAPQTMREALRDPATARELLVHADHDYPQVPDVQMIASKLGLHSKVARRLPIVDKWEVGWFDTDGTFVADPSHELVDSLGFYPKAKPLGLVPVQIISDDKGPRITSQRGDVNNDGAVNEVDMEIVIFNLEQTGPDLTKSDGDLNGDRQVDGWDILYVLETLYDL